MRSGQRFSYLALEPEETRTLNAAYHERIHHDQSVRAIFRPALPLKADKTIKPLPTRLLVTNLKRLQKKQ